MLTHTFLHSFSLLTFHFFQQKVWDRFFFSSFWEVDNAYPPFFLFLSFWMSSRELEAAAAAAEVVVVVVCCAFYWSMKHIEGKQQSWSLEDTTEIHIYQAFEHKEMGMPVYITNLSS